MKKKILISLVACFIAAGSFIGYNLTENTSRLDISLADISVMAQADGESGSGACFSWGYKTWDYWMSGANGVDCDCNDRNKVWTEC